MQNKALILDLLAFVAEKPRPYAEVMDAWRTSCPRLPVWEDANDLGFVAWRRDGALGTIVHLTPEGADFLRRERPR
ncbi:MAG TPA: hypothetical protein VFC53_07445 [Dehalococcoidia bacterium]|nr:hypothetical protein [Dehalococcoidia bacterium]